MAKSEVCGSSVVGATSNGGHVGETIESTGNMDGSDTLGFELGCSVEDSLGNGLGRATTAREAAFPQKPPFAKDLLSGVGSTKALAVSSSESSSADSSASSSIEHWI